MNALDMKNQNKSKNKNKNKIRILIKNKIIIFNQFKEALYEII